MEHEDGSTPKSQFLWKCTQVIAQDFMKTLGSLTLRKTISKPSSTKHLELFLFPGSELKRDFSKQHHCLKCLRDTPGSVGRARVHLKLSEIVLMILMVLSLIFRDIKKNFEFWNPEKNLPWRLSRSFEAHQSEQTAKTLSC